MLNLDFKLLHGAIAVAEELNFTRAAQTLHVSQSALSRQIQELEELIGVSLFVRSKKKVAITEAGHVFVDEARLCLMHAERAFHFARAAAHDAVESLVIGRSPFADPKLISHLLSTSVPLHSNLRIKLKSDFSLDLVRSVLAAEMDLALVTEPPETPLLSKVRVSSSPVYVAFPPGDAPQRSNLVKLTELEGRSWLLFGRKVHPVFYDTLIDKTRSRNVVPKEIHHIMSADEALHLLSEHVGVAFVTQACATRLSAAGVDVRQLDDDGFVLETHLVSRSENTSKVVSAFVRSFVKRLNAVGSSSSQLALPIGA